MKENRLFRFVGVLLLGVILTVAADENWMNMSGSFDGWHQAGNANWRIENGEFVADTGKGYLVTNDSFTDVRIKAEFWVSEGANSGVYVRISNPDAITDSTAYEVNIFDSPPVPDFRTGALVHFAPPSVTTNTPGHWNTYDITFQGEHIKVVLNGITVVDIHDSTYKSGPVGLQYGAGTVKFRNVQIQKL